MSEKEKIAVPNLGPCEVHSPLRRDARGAMKGTFVTDNMFLRYPIAVDTTGEAPVQLFEKAGPREKIFFDPARTKAAIVTCGGLCPGLNNVIRSVYLELHFHYGVNAVLGIRYGYAGFAPEAAASPVWLNTEMVNDIHQRGGTLLGSSRGPVSADIIVDVLEQRGINILFAVGGDGTQRGAHGIAEEVKRRNLKISVIGIPKTIDDDVMYVNRSFGYFTAIARAKDIIDSAHVEAQCALNGVSIVKVMGRDSGFIAAGATLASQEVNFALVPEAPFKLEGDGGLLAALHRRLLERHHALIVVAEGAGQDLMPPVGRARCLGQPQAPRHWIVPERKDQASTSPSSAFRSPCAISIPATTFAAFRRRRSIRCCAIPSRATRCTPPWRARPTSSSDCSTACSSTCRSRWRRCGASSCRRRNGPAW